MPPYKNLDDAARELGIPRRTLQRWIGSGKLTGYKIEGDRRRYVDLAEVKRLRKPRPK